MVINKKVEYISFDGKVFDDKELCERYESTYLTDNQLEQCFYFFHSDIDILKYDKEYKFKIKRDLDSQLIELYDVEYDEPTRYGLLIKSNYDFVVYCESQCGMTDRYYQGSYTKNIKEFYKFLDSLN